MKAEQHDAATLIEDLEEIRRKHGAAPVYVETDTGIFAAYDLTVEEWGGVPVVILSLGRDSEERPS